MLLGILQYHCSLTFPEVPKLLKAPMSMSHPVHRRRHDWSQVNKFMPRIYSFIGMSRIARDSSDGLRQLSLFVIGDTNMHRHAYLSPKTIIAYNETSWYISPFSSGGLGCVACSRFRIIRHYGSHRTTTLAVIVTAKLFRSSLIFSPDNGGDAFLRNISS
jgi:hypothetical protein